MTTIILTIIGVLIAAAAVLFLIFYGGDAYSDSTAEAEAATMITQSTQINAAFDIYKAEKGKNPGNADGTGALDDLVENDYLTQIPPRPANNNYSPDWIIDYRLGMARTTLGRSDDEVANKVCEKARARMGMKGDPLRCDDPSMSSVDPCCVMAEDEL